MGTAQQHSGCSAGGCLGAELERGLSFQRRRKAVSEKGILSALLILVGAGSGSPASGPRASFFFKHCPAGKRRAMAQGSLQMIMELGSLFKDKLTQEEWFPHLYWYSCTSPPVQDDWVPLV